MVILPTPDEIRCARRLCIYHGLDPDNHSDQNTQWNWVQFIPQVRAVIDEIRTPSKEMTAAAFDAGIYYYAKCWDVMCNAASPPMEKKDG